MISRYKIYRGKRPAQDPLPDGIRQDTRKHTSHVLAPETKMVFRALADSTAAGWARFEKAYVELLESRYKSNRDAFAELVKLSESNDVYIGCNCPTQAQPDVMRCHTVVALRFLRKKFRGLDVRLPDPAASLPKRGEK